MNILFKLIGYIPRVACLTILPLTLIFDLVTLFKYKETKGLWEYIIK